MNRQTIVLSAIGMIGGGIPEDSLSLAIEKHPDVICADCGSIDSGPYSLGTGVPNKPRKAIKRDLRLMLLAGVKNNIPVLVGSAGTSGGDQNLAWVIDIVEEIAKEEELHFKLAVISSELSHETLRSALKSGKVGELYPAPELTEESIDSIEHAVAMMGPEPYVEALKNGAQVVIAGRSSDCSIFAAMPILRGQDTGATWHAAKLLECGSLCAAEKPSNPECMMAWIGDDGFSVEAANPAVRVTPRSCAMNALHENDNPFDLVEPGRILHIKDAQYIAESERRVHVSGSYIEKTPYTVRLEGARFVGHRSVVFGAIHDPLVIGQVDQWIERVRAAIAKKVKRSMDMELDKDYELAFRVYGKGLTPDPDYVPRELCLMITAASKDEETASAVGGIAWHVALHCPIPEWAGAQSNLAFPISPPCMSAGPAYNFCLNHVINLDHPLELFPITYREL